MNEVFGIVKRSLLVKGIKNQTKIHLSFRFFFDIGISVESAQRKCNIRTLPWFPNVTAIVCQIFTSLQAKLNEF